MNRKAVEIALGFVARYSGSDAGDAAKREILETLDAAIARAEAAERERDQLRAKIAHTAALTPREQLTNLLANDARNLAYASRERDREVTETVTTDCAQRLVQAWDLGDPELTAQAERQLREAVALLGGGA